MNKLIFHGKIKGINTVICVSKKCSLNLLWSIASPCTPCWQKKSCRREMPHAWRETVLKGLHLPLHKVKIVVGGSNYPVAN